MTIINPATEEIIQEVKEDTEATVHEKYQQVKAGQFFLGCQAGGRKSDGHCQILRGAGYGKGDAGSNTDRRDG